MTEISAIIVAAGHGERFQSDLPKQYNMLGNQSILTHAINGLISHPKVDELIVVIHKNHEAEFQKAISNINDPKLQPVVVGAHTRGESVFSGLKAARGERVLIHDAARPLLPHAALDRLIGALETKPAAFLALPIVDALWRDTDALTPVSRSDVWRAQTPQAFLRQDLISAYETAGFNLSDDVEVALSAGIEATPILGDEENFKITHPEDLHRAKRVLEARMTPRIGIGYDVHAFENGNAVTLNGIEIAHDRALKGHSDADVAMHAITDAIYGALADGDIGQHFPPTDPSWKDQASDLFLRHACQRCKEAGYKIANLDCTIICEQPKIGPHALNMRENLAQICAIKLSQVSVKATTSEQLGFTGREEGIAAQAIAQLVPA